MMCMSWTDSKQWLRKQVTWKCSQGQAKCVATRWLPASECAGPPLGRTAVNACRRHAAWPLPPLPRLAPALLLLLLLPLWLPGKLPVL